MQTISTTAIHNDLMAAWRATGGAIPAPMSDATEAGGDDGLSAVLPSMPPICYRIDDGLMASPVTVFVPCLGDEGLTAGNPTRPPECWGVAVIEDDGLTASNVSPTYPGFCWGPR